MSLSYTPYTRSSLSKIASTAMPIILSKTKTSFLAKEFFSTFESSTTSTKNLQIFQSLVASTKTS